MKLQSPWSAPTFLLALWLPLSAFAAAEEKVYVAVEGEGTVAVFDAASRQLLKRIDLAADTPGGRRLVAAHNVQVAPDGGSVWVTANGGHGEHSGGEQEPSGHEEHSGGAAEPSGHEAMGHAAVDIPPDEVVVIDPLTDAVARRIPIAPGQHLAHVVLSPDSAYAYISAQNASVLYKINARSYQVESKIPLPPGSQPHGLRIAPDGSRAYIALLQGRGLGVLDLATLALEVVPLNGAAVQTAVTPDGRKVLVSLYDSKQLAVYEPASKALRYIDLNKSAKGPVQVYPTPDSRYAYVADQGHYFGQPDSQWVYKVDLTQAGPAAWPIKAGTAPHGIVVAKDGLLAYVTNLVSNDLSVIDLRTGQEAARLPVGAEPNGVSVWNKEAGGTP
jgi:YVTN family beta-propeller protein